MIPFIRRAILLIPLLLLGCARQPTAPGGQRTAPDSEPLMRVGVAVVPSSERSGVMIFPLEIGNSWTHDHHFISTVTTADETRTYERQNQMVSLVGCPQRFEAHDYLGFLQAGGGIFLLDGWSSYRQDRAGLYSFGWDYTILCEGGPALGSRGVRERAAATAPPPAFGLRNAVAERAALRELRRHSERIEQARSDLGLGPRRPSPGGPEEYESIVLAYPLHPGQRWSPHPRLRRSATVERLERLQTEAGPVLAYRIRVRHPMDREGDLFLLWYGPTGFVGSFIRYSGTAVDDWGNPIGTFVTEDRTLLTSYSLAGRQAPSKP